MKSRKTLIVLLLVLLGCAGFLQAQQNNGTDPEQLSTGLGWDAYREQHGKWPSRDERKQTLKKAMVNRVNEAEKCAKQEEEFSEEHNKLYTLSDYGYSQCFNKYDVWMRIYIYPNKTIKDIYKLYYVEYLEGAKSAYHTPLSILNAIYPPIMPTKDYFPFTDLEYRAPIPLPLTEEERQRYGSGISDVDWSYCILWLDEHRMLMHLADELYYFKQVGKDVHFFRLTYPN